MKSLDEHNKEQWERLAPIISGQPVPNGIACPKCGAEMMDSTPHLILTSNPPKHNVHCPKCGHRDYRL